MDSEIRIFEKEDSPGEGRISGTGRGRSLGRCDMGMCQVCGAGEAPRYVCLSSSQRTRPPALRRGHTCALSQERRGGQSRRQPGAQEQSLEESALSPQCSSQTRTNAPEEEPYLISFLSSSSAAWFSPGQILALNFLHFWAASLCSSCCCNCFIR